MRLIDADALEEKLHDLFLCANDSLFHVIKAMNNMPSFNYYCGAKNKIEECNMKRSPEEVKHGLANDLSCCFLCDNCHPTLGNPYGCGERAYQIEIAEDALNYIIQLENELNMSKKRLKMLEKS